MDIKMEPIKIPLCFSEPETLEELLAEMQLWDDEITVDNNNDISYNNNN
jgi:sulfur carrier protein ThiS